MASQFNSSFSKPDFSATNITFLTEEGEKLAKVGEIVSSLNGRENNRDKYFYLYYKRKLGIDAEIDNQDICRKFFKDVVF